MCGSFNLLWHVSSCGYVYSGEFIPVNLQQSSRKARPRTFSVSSQAMWLARHVYFSAGAKERDMMAWHYRAPSLSVKGLLRVFWSDYFVLLNEEEIVRFNISYFCSWCVCTVAYLPLTLRFQALHCSEWSPVTQTVNLIALTWEYENIRTLPCSHGCMWWCFFPC